MRKRKLYGQRKRALVSRARLPLKIFWGILSVFARRENSTPRAVLEKLRRASRSKNYYAPGQWHRWYKINRKRQRQLRAIKQRGGGWIDPTLTGLPRYFVQ